MWIYGTVDLPELIFWKPGGIIRLRCTPLWFWAV